MSSRILPLTTCVVGLAGCMLESTPILPAPIPASEQQFSVLEIVQPGTERDEAIARLNEAGILGSFGATGAKSVFYCDVWNREDGERWHLDVAVLFDDQGRVINTRVGDSTPIESDSQPRSPTSAEPTRVAAEPTADREQPGPRGSVKPRWTLRRTAFTGN